MTLRKKRISEDLQMTMTVIMNLALTIKRRVKMTVIPLEKKTARQMKMKERTWYNKLTTTRTDLGN